MKITKIFNNNAVIAISQDKTEMIVTGPGIEFHRTARDRIDERKTEKRYLTESTQRTRLYQVLESIPVEYFKFSEIIFKKTFKGFEGDLNNQMVLLLADHIVFATEREEQGMYLPSLLLPEIKILCHKEYQIGVWALKYIVLKTGVHLSLDEAGPIAMHIVNSGNQGHKNSAEEVLTSSKQILHITEVTAHINQKEKDFDQTRPTMHLKYLR